MIGPITEQAPIARAPAAVAHGRSRSDWLPIATLYIAAVALYILLGRGQAVPLTVPDELTYGHLASAMAQGSSLGWRGDPVSLRAALYVYLVTPAWVVASGTTAYAIAKVIGALALCAVVFPVWLVGRPALGQRVAIVPALLSVLGTWMVSAGGVLTENLALPLATCALAATVWALRTSSARWCWIAIALAVVAAWARLQLAALFVVIVAALLIDVLLSGDRRQRLRQWRAPLIAVGAGVVVTIVAAFAAPRSVLGSYSGVRGYANTPVGEIVAHVRNQWVTLVAMTAAVPFVVALGAAATRSTWRDREVWPLLAVLIPAAAVLIVESAIFDAGYGIHGSIQRYVEYVAPIAFVTAAVVLQREVASQRALAASAGLIAASTLLAPAIGNAPEERAITATWARLHGLLGVSPAIALALMAIGLSTVVLVVMRRSGLGGSLGVIVVFGTLAAALAVQSETAWQQQRHLSQTWRSQLPADLEWLQHQAPWPVARLFATTNSPLAADFEFFSRRIIQVYAPPHGYRGQQILGRSCPWNVRADGTAVFDRRCGPPPHRFFFDDANAAIAFYRQRLVASSPRFGAIIEVPGTPRVRAVILLPCARQRFMRSTADSTRVWIPRGQICRGGMTASLWLDRPASLVLRFRGGAEPHAASLGGHVYSLPAGTDTTIRLPAAAGPRTLRLSTDWTSDLRAPRLVGIELVDSRGSERML